MPAPTTLDYYLGGGHGPWFPVREDRDARSHRGRRQRYFDPTKRGKKKASENTHFFHLHSRRLSKAPIAVTHEPPRPRLAKIAANSR